MPSTATPSFTTWLRRSHDKSQTLPTRRAFSARLTTTSTAIASGTYTAGGSLLWLGLRWSATPGVPLRLHAVKKLPNTLFDEPKPYPGALRVAVTPGYAPLNHWGRMAWS